MVEPRTAAREDTGRALYVEPGTCCRSRGPLGYVWKHALPAGRQVVFLGSQLVRPVARAWGRIFCGCRATPCLTGLDEAFNSGLWIAAVGRESVATAPGASSKDEVEFTCPDWAIAEGPRVMKNAAASCKMFKWQCGVRFKDPTAADRLACGATRCAKQYSAESLPGLA